MYHNCQSGVQVPQMTLFQMVAIVKKKTTSLQQSVVCAYFLDLSWPDIKIFNSNLVRNEKTITKHVETDIVANNASKGI